MVTLLLKDSSGRFWIGTGDGLHVSTGTGFEKIKIASDGFVKAGLRIPRRGYVDANGRVYIGYEAGVFMFQNADAYLHDSKELLGFKWPEFLGEDETYVFLMRGFNDLVMIPKKPIDTTLQDSKIVVIPNYFAFNSTFKTLLNKNRNSGIIFGNDSFYNYKFNSNHKIEFKLITLAGNKPISAMCYFKDGTIAFTSNNEVYKLDPWKKEISLILSVPIQKIVAISVDDFGNYWLGAENGKLIFVESKTGEQHINPDFFPLGISIRFITSIDQKIFVGTDGKGLAYHIPSRHKFDHFMVDPQNAFPLFYIKTLAELSNGDLILGSNNRGIIIYKKNDGFVFPKIKVDNKTDFSVNKILKLVDNFYLGTSQGLLIWREKTPEQLFNTKVEIPIRYLYQIDSNQLLLNSTDGSIFIYNLIKQKTTDTLKYRAQIYDITKDDGFLIAGHSGGLIKIQKDFSFEIISKWNGVSVFGILKKDSSFYLATQDGLIISEPDFINYRIIFKENFIYDLIDDNKGNLWLSGLSSVFRYNYKTQRESHFDAGYGQKLDEFYNNTILMNSAGAIYIGGASGFVKFYPFEEDEVIYKESVFLHKLKLGLDLFNDSFPKQIKFNNNSLSFFLSHFDPTAHPARRIRYFLEGSDYGWRETRGGDEIFYNNLKPGKYKLFISKQLNEQNWSDPELLWEFEVLSPFYYKSWFLISLCVFILFLIFTAARKVNSQKFKNRIRILEKEQAIAYERNRISQDMHDDLGSELSKIALWSKGLIGKSGSDYAEKIYISSKKLIDGMGSIIWALNSVNDPLPSIGSYFGQYALDFFENTSVICRIKPLEYNDDDLRFTSEIRRALFLIFKEIINNILKHSEANYCEIGFYLKKGYFEIEIIEDGKNYDYKKSLNESRGLKNIKLRAQRIGADIDYQFDNLKKINIRIKAPTSLN